MDTQVQHNNPYRGIGGLLDAVSCVGKAIAKLAPGLREAFEQGVLGSLQGLLYEHVPRAVERTCLVADERLDRIRAGALAALAQGGRPVGKAIWLELQADVRTAWHLKPGLVDLAATGGVGCHVGCDDDFVGVLLQAQRHAVDGGEICCPCVAYRQDQG